MRNMVIKGIEKRLRGTSHTKCRKNRILLKNIISQA